MTTSNQTAQQKNTEPKIIVLDDATWDALIEKGWLVDDDEEVA